MVVTQNKQVTEQDLKNSRLSVIIHGLNMKTKEKDLEKLIKQKLSIPSPVIKFGEPYSINGQQQRQAYINFGKEETVNELMKNRPIICHGQKLTVSRYNPKNCHLSGHITSALSLTINKTKQDKNGFKKELTEYDLNKYFEKFGKIVHYTRENDEEVILQFEDYDSVDRIIQSGISHIIAGINIDVKKNVTSTSDLRPYCIHVTNMPMDVKTEELSSIFGIHVANILLRPGYQFNQHLVPKDRLKSEAWIKRVGNQETARALASKHSGFDLRGYKIRCDTIIEPLTISELCKYFEKGKCLYSLGQECIYKHIMCDEPDECENKKCWYGHNKKRPIISGRRLIQDSDKSSYRVKISNLPSTTTEKQLMERLDISERNTSCLKFPRQPAPDMPIVVYLVNQSSEKFLQSKILECHNKPFSTDMPNTMKCQLEMNVDFFDPVDKCDLFETSARSGTSSPISSTGSSIRSTITKPNPWYKGKDEGQSNSEDDQQNRETEAAIKPYISKHDVGKARHEQIALEKLAGIDGVPKIIVSNTDVKNGVESNNDSRIVMEHIKGCTLSNFIKKNSINLSNALIITLKLLNIVKQIHCRNIVHRNIRPENIIIRDQLDIKNNSNNNPLCYDEINLALIDFSFACINQESDGNIKQNRMIFEDNHDVMLNDFYQVPQFERQTSIDNINKHKYSQTIDTSLICAILFWMITKSCPKESRNIHGQAPHELKNHINFINEELQKATGIWTEIEKRVPLELHLKLIFDRGFADPDRQWSIEELEYQLRFMLQLTVKNNQEDTWSSSSLSKNPIESLLNTSKCESFLQLTSLIGWIKNQFELRYPIVHWLTNEKSQWSGNSQKIENHDFLIVTKQQQQRVISLEIFWYAEINNKQEIVMTIKAKINHTTFVELPLGVCKQSGSENILKLFELQLKTLIDMLYKNKNM